MFKAVLIVIVVALGLPAGAAAFDTGPHGDITVDALRAEGFNPDAADVGRINNWFVDMYSNASSYPYSGHADAVKVLLGGALGNSEHWSKTVVKSASALHFDSGVPNAETTAGLEAEWQRLRGAVYNMVQDAKARRNPMELMMIIGASLHAVQDFYSHTNFAEPQGVGVFEAPGWLTRNQGLTPTWFDLTKDVRDGAHIYAGAAKGITRAHGGFKSEPNKSMAKDDPGRPNYRNGYISAYFASRQWIESIRIWLNDESLWGAAMRWRNRIRELEYDIRGAIGMSTYSGHLYGAGEPWAPGNSDKRGWGGSLVALRSVVQSYFEDRGRTIYRRMFERQIPKMAAQPLPPVSDQQAPISSSRPLQANTRFVQLQILYMRGLGLGDPGPDDADMYSRATIDGQRYVSAVIQAHDRFSFGKPYHPFTFIKSIPKSATWDEPITDLNVEIRTSSSRFSGTDDSMYLRISRRHRFPLDKLLYDDFERGDRDTYSVPIDAIARTGLTMRDLQYVQIEKARDGIAGGYKLGGVTLRVNGRVVVTKNSIERWLEDNHRTWRASGFAGSPQLGQKLPVWFDLREDDLRIYGGDDQGDVNPFDGRDAIVRDYLPGTLEETPTTGGRKYGGRRTKGGDKATLKYRIETLDTSLPPPPPTSDQPPGPAFAPDLVITSLSSNSFALKNQGNAPAGPFTVKVNNSTFIPFGGLAAGAETSYTYGAGCNGGGYSAFVDINNEVIESNEANNLFERQIFC